MKESLETREALALEISAAAIGHRLGISSATVKKNFDKDVAPGLFWLLMADMIIEHMKGLSDERTNRK